MYVCAFRFSIVRSSNFSRFPSKLYRYELFKSQVCARYTIFKTLPHCTENYTIKIVETQIKRNMKWNTKICDIEEAAESMHRFITKKKKIPHTVQLITVLFVNCVINLNCIPLVVMCTVCSSCNLSFLFFFLLFFRE